MNIQKQNKRIGELLAEAGLIDERQLQESLQIQARQGGKIAEILLSLGYINAPCLMRFLQKTTRAPNINISSFDVPRQIISLIPKEIALKYDVFPIDVMKGSLTLGMICPLDKATIQILEQHTGLKIKPVLCSASDLRMAIDRYYKDMKLEGWATESPVPVEALEVPLRLSGIAALLRSINSFPPLPKTVEALRNAIADPNHSVADIAAIISNDAGVASKILSVANSSAYSFSRTVKDLTLAVSLIGYGDIFGIVLASSAVNGFKRKGLIDYERFSGDAFRCAMIARTIAAAAGKGRLSGILSAGLLHDIGRPALAEAAPGHYAKIDPELQDSDLVAEEEKLIGISHPEAGYELAIN
ncbi:MAG: HDOD domain-containing protein, partial [Proteobacteria bacterium]|nr:HDOD domain-containing protein [Pseudomonadota bacterium]